MSVSGIDHLALMANSFSFFQGCNLEKVCEAVEDECAMGNRDCKSWCCSGDDCNGVSSIVSSLGVVLLGTVLAALVTMH